MTTIIKVKHNKSDVQVNNNRVAEYKILQIIISKLNFYYLLNKGII